MTPHYHAPLTKPTPAMRRFLAKLANGGTQGIRTHGEMGHPAYPMRLAMERAGWLTCVYSRDSREIWGKQPSQIWCTPQAYRITAAGRKAIGEVARAKHSAKLERPKGWSNRDVLCGVLAAAASQLKIPCALDVAAKACEPLWQGRRLDPGWYPIISSAHARTAVRCARAALSAGGISKLEYDFVCGKARRVLVRAQPLESPDADENQSAA